MGWNIGELLGYSLDYRRSTLTINDTHAKTWKQGDTRKENPQRTSLGHHDYKKDNHKENVNGEKCKTPSEKGDVGGGRNGPFLENFGNPNFSKKNMVI